MSGVKAEQLRGALDYEMGGLGDLAGPDHDALIFDAARSFLAVLDPSDELVERVAKVIAAPLDSKLPYKAGIRKQAVAILAEIGELLNLYGLVVIVEGGDET